MTGGLAALSSLNVKLTNRETSDQGTATCAAGDTGGTLVAFNKVFVDVNSINATPRGTTLRHAVVNFTDTPNPTSFRILLFDNAGNRVSGDADWIARGT